MYQIIYCITKNLRSVSLFAIDNQVFFEFHPNVCFVKSQGSNEVILKGLLKKDGLYKFRSMINHSASAALSPNNVSLRQLLGIPR